MGGFEPPTSPLPRVCSTPELHEHNHNHWRLERVAGIEPASSAWKAEVIATIPYPPIRSDLVVGGGFEPPKLSRQIYSLIPLATREPHHIFLRWCRHQESNSGPTDYKSVALPTELCRRAVEVAQILLITPGACKPFLQFFLSFLFFYRNRFKNSQAFDFSAHILCKHHFKGTIWPYHHAILVASG